jgi:hypothetical protein
MPIRVLVVVDGNHTGPGFNLATSDLTDDSFTVAAFVQTLRNSTTPIITVDTAHRHGDPNATIAGNFNFATSVNLSDYDQIWMFGYDGSNFGGSGMLNFIADSELTALTKFMDGGGGVFATGDHDGLGSLMCGRIPRVRTMRKWFAASDNDSRVPAAAPRNWPGAGPTRADTLQPDLSNAFHFDNQSDDTPQPLTFPGGVAHTILQGDNGPITGFPDHMHEGEVILPWDMTLTAASDPSLSFAPGGFVEYPTLNGFQATPEIIATGKVIGGHATPIEGSTCEQINFFNETELTVANDNLNILCVYDGHSVGVGRVVTDSSFHHYLDLNLTGDPCGVAYKQQGFTGSQVLTDLQTFFINTVVWLSRVNTNCYFSVDKNTFGVDEVSDVNFYPTAFWVVLDGFSPNQVGGSAPTLSGPFKNLNGVILTPGSPVFEVPGSPNTPQRIRFPFDVQFTSLSPFPTGATPVQAALEATLFVAGNAFSPETSFELVPGADPYFTNVNPAQDNVFYLSQDLRVFRITPGLSSPPIPDLPVPFPTSGPLTIDPNAAHTYIQGLLTTLNNNYSDPAGTDPFTLLPDQNSALSEDSSVALFTFRFPLPFLNYNFAIARVRLKGTAPITAPNVKVFFRMFATQSNDTDYQPTTTYLSTLDSNGLPALPLAGPGNDTIPFFASGSAGIDYAAGGPNNRPIDISSGDSTWAYFGCYLNVFDPSISALLPGTHHCLVAQIAYDPAPIVNSNGLTLSPENSDKLAQRNLQVTTSDNPGAPATHRIPQTFDLRPSQPIVQDGEDLLNYPDELMIDWGNTPVGSRASIYWPQVKASDVVRMGALLYSTNQLSAADSHTIQCPVTGGATYIPIPSGAGQNFAGLFTVDLPPTVVKGQEFNIVVRRVSTRRFGNIPNPTILTESLARTPRLGALARSQGKGTVTRNWRYVVGTFQVKIPVSTKDVLLLPEENTLAIMKWRLSRTPASNRWYPVLQRYISYIAGRVDGLGGNSGSIQPSPTGVVPKPGHCQDHPHQHPCGDPHCDDPCCVRSHIEPCAPKCASTGKVCGLIYDRFGDFDGFLLVTEDGTERSFHAREAEIESLVRFAWTDRVVVTVLVREGEPDRPVSIVLRRAPRQLGH